MNRRNRTTVRGAALFASRQAFVNKRFLILHSQRSRLSAFNDGVIVVVSTLRTVSKLMKKKASKWHLKLGIETEDADHLVTKIEITLSYHTYGDLIINLRLAKTLIESANEVSISLIGGTLMYAEGFNALTGAVTRRIDR